jgi:hypothetical protein
MSIPPARLASGSKRLSGGNFDDTIAAPAMTCKLIAE